MRWWLGPVFIYECVANSRRWQTYAIRSFGVAALLVAMSTIASSYHPEFVGQSWREYTRLGESYFYAMIGVELALVMLAAPAATAGAICLDRARGTLAHMMVTDLSDPEIVLGKLAARLLPALGLVACSWPVLAISALLGGIDPTALTLAFAVILAVALLGCTMALALSVWARKPHEVVLVTYTAWMLVLLIWPIWFALSKGKLVSPPPHWSLVADPYYLAFAPYSAPGQVDFWDYLGFFVVTLGASALLMVPAILRMRPVANRGTDEPRQRPGLGLVARLTRGLPGPSLDGNPVLWREWHRSRPSRWLMILVVVIGGATGIACVSGAVSIWANGLDDFQKVLGPWTIVGVYGCFIQMIFGFLMLSAVAPMSMSEERQRGSLDLLAATTLSTPTIVIGKWLGMLRLVLLLAIGRALLGFALATAKTPSTRPPPPGLPAGSAAESSTSELLFGASLLVATTLIHGMLLSTIGLAMAIWTRRQSRAIAFSVGLAVMLYAGWPIFIGVSGMGPPAEVMMGVSPVVACGILMEELLRRYPQIQEVLWWTSFWDIECLVLSLGLLWLAVRTFDACLGRIPERPRRTSVLADVIVLLASLIGVGSLFGAIPIWVYGWPGFNAGLEIGVCACALLVAVGLLLLAVRAPLSISHAGAPRVLALEPVPVTPDRRLFVGRWWESFRLVLLLAIGPALIGLAVATAHKPVRVVPKITNLPNGSKEEISTSPSGTTFVITTDASGGRRIREATDAEIAARPVQPGRSRAGLLTPALLAVLTVLAHGASVVSLGLAVAIGIRGRGRAIALSVGLFLFVTVGWPLLYYLCLYSPTHLVGQPIYPRGLVLASPVPAIVVLLLDVAHVDGIADLVWSTFWNGVLILLSVFISALAIWALGRRSRAYPAPELDAEYGTPVIETVLLSD
jgi:ABC-type transport system involved in multi-copper enzyme maturation permease subunit